MESTMPTYLRSTCDEGCNARCPDAVRRRRDKGRWYITIGHPGFNSPANNASGYLAASTATAAVAYYASRDEVGRA